jgi:hypothetical protein
MAEEPREHRTAETSDLTWPNERVKMSGLDNFGFADNINVLRRNLAELQEMVRLGARIPGDDQRIEAIKRLLAQWQAFASVSIPDGADPNTLMESSRAGGETAALGPQMG